MSERAKIPAKTPEAKRKHTISRKQKTTHSQSRSSPVNRILFLQQTVGNQAVRRMMKSGAIQTKLRNSISCPVSPRRCPFGGACHTCPVRVQTKPLSEHITPLVQRQEEEEKEEEELVQTKPIAEQMTPFTQRQVEEEEKEEPIQTKSLTEQNTPLLQRQVDEKEEEEPVQAKLTDEKLIQRQYEDETEEEEEPLQAKENSGQRLQVTPSKASQIQSLKTGGQPLPKATRDFFEPRFGVDFSGVRVHHNIQAAKAAHSINARAFTIGRDIIFGMGQYAPDTTFGKKLLAHELGHAIQQGLSASTGTKTQLNRPAVQRGQSLIRLSNEFPMIQPWRRSGNVATVHRQGDTLWNLARSITKHGRDWACIWPISMRNPARPYWRHLRIGDQFDISNLTATTGTNSTIRMDTTGCAGIVNQTFYGGTAATTGPAVMRALRNRSGEGKTPIQTFLIAGHADPGWGAELRSDPGSANNFNVGGTDPNQPLPTYARANAREGPHRCWFTRRAATRAAGCSTETFARGFAAAFLRRRRSSITATTGRVTSHCGPPPYRTVAGSPIRYFNAATFHAVPGLWIVIRGRVV